MFPSFPDHFLASYGGGPDKTPQIYRERSTRHHAASLAALPLVILHGAADLLTREHRLYQVDFLIRKYHWSEGDFEFETNGDLSLDADPKELWARRHPEFFPVRIRSADRERLLRVPGIGPVTAKRIVEARRTGAARCLRDLGLRGKRLEQVRRHVVME